MTVYELRVYPKGYTSAADADITLFEAVDDQAAITHMRHFAATELTAADQGVWLRREGGDFSIASEGGPS